MGGPGGKPGTQPGPLGAGRAGEHQWIDVTFTAQLQLEYVVNLALIPSSRRYERSQRRKLILTGRKYRLNNFQCAIAVKDRTETRAAVKHTHEETGKSRSLLHTGVHRVDEVHHVHRTQGVDDGHRVARNSYAARSSK